jgi:zinc transport system substrate-binding protein
MRIVLAIALVSVATACGSGAGGGRRVVAAFYPLAFAAEQVGAPGLHVENLTPPGAEPHDIELTPRQVADVQRAAVTLYLSHGFQPAVQDAVDGARGMRIDALEGLDLAAGVGDEAGSADPHVWLDPVLYARVVRRVGAALHRPGAAEVLAARLRRLDREYRAGLSHCARRTFVTSHAAFGYLAQRYGLRQVAITGVDPESEPSARKLASLVQLVRRLHVDTVFFERLVSPRLAQTVAREAGVRTAVLDPIEGLTPSEAKAGDTYFTLMRQNLAELRQELGCR